MQLILQTRKNKNQIVLHCYGKIIRGLEADNFERELHGLLVLTNEVSINLKCVRTIDARGLGILAAAASKARQEHKFLELCYAPHNIVRLLQLTKLDHVIPIHAGELNDERALKVTLVSTLCQEFGFA